MQTWELKIQMSVTDSWVQDGFDLKERIGDIEEKLQQMLPYAFEGEIDIKINVTKEPSKDVIIGLRNGDVEAKD